MLRRWLKHSDHGNLFLFGLEAHMWDEAHEGDLVTIPRPDSELERDGLSRLFLGPLLEKYHEWIGRFHVVCFSSEISRTVRRLITSIETHPW